MAGNKNWFKAKKLSAIFGGVAFIVGFFLLDRGITGNVVLNNQSPVDVVSLIGLLLVFCSAILAFYSIRR